MIEYLLFTSVALVLTVAVESGVAWIFGFRNKREFAALALINVITNPMLNYLMVVNSYFHLVAHAIAMLLFLEAAVLLAEWRLVIWALRRDARTALALSAAMNASSFLAGYLIFR